MSGLACIKCRVFLVPVKTGAYVEEGWQPGDLGGDWAPYKLWMCDIAECPRCGFRLAHGFGRRPIAEHFQEDYQQVSDASRPIVRIDACHGHKP